MKLTINDLADELRRFSEYLQRVGGELFVEAFRIHQIRALTVQQLRYLEVIEGNPGIAPGDLVDLFSVKKPTVSNVLRRLERDGLVVRHEDAGDRRIHRMFPTEITKDIFERRRGMYVSLATHIGEKLSVSEVRTLVGLLGKVAPEAGNGNG